MSTVLAQFPGQIVTVVQQVLNSDGYRADGYVVPGVSGPDGEPVIARVILPGLTLASGYPATMSQLDTGLYAFTFTLPSGAVSVGLYAVDIYWYNPSTYALQQELVFVNVTAPFGVYSIGVVG
jgi:hypothetical protein